MELFIFAEVSEHCFTFIRRSEQFEKQTRKKSTRFFEAKQTSWFIKRLTFTHTCWWIKISLTHRKSRFEWKTKSQIRKISPLHDFKYREMTNFLRLTKPNLHELQHSKAISWDLNPQFIEIFSSSVFVKFSSYFVIGYESRVLERFHLILMIDLLPNTFFWSPFVLFLLFPARLSFHNLFLAHHLYQGYTQIWKTQAC